MPPQSRYVWSGTVSFGLVAIPVGVVPAVREGRIGFHLLHAADHARLERRMICPADEHIIPSEHQVRGYEIEPGKYVALSDEELDAIAAKKSQTIEITNFVDIDAIDPLYYDHPYYLIPLKGAQKPYRLLVEALDQTGKAGLSMFVMRATEYPVAIRALDGALSMSTLHFADEIVSSEGIAPANKRAKAAELQSLQNLIKRMSGEFEPEKYADPYREQLMALIQSKFEKKEVVEAPQREEQQISRKEASELMAALKESLDKAGRRKADGRSTGRRRKTRQTHQSR